MNFNELCLGLAVGWTYCIKKRGLPRFCLFSQPHLFFLVRARVFFASSLSFSKAVGMNESTKNQS